MSRSEQADQMGSELDEDLRRYVRHDQIKGFRQGGDIAIPDLDTVVHLIDPGVNSCDLHGFLVDVHAEDLLGVQFRAGDAEDARPRSDIEDAPLIDCSVPEEDLFDCLQTHPCRGVLAGAEGHAGVDLNDDVPAGR